MKTVDEIKEFFEKDKFAKNCNIEIVRATDGEAECVMAVTDVHKNAVGGVQGGAIFTLADYTFAIASNFNCDACVSVSASISYMRVAKTNELTAIAQRVGESRNMAFYEVKVSDGVGVIAVAKFDGYKIQAKKQ
jgi:acyl-CoA thioesterase